MTLRTQMVTDGATFVNLDEFGESITYTPKGASPKVINAVIRRRRPDATSQDRSRAVQLVADVWVRNDATTGVALVTRTADKLTFPRELGGPAEDFFVLDILHRDDPGVWHIQVGR